VTICDNRRPEETPKMESSRRRPALSRLLLAAAAAALASTCRASSAPSHFEAKNAVGPYSAAVVAEGRLVFLSGKIGTPGGAFADEMNGALDAVTSDLTRAGATLADVVSVNVFLADMALFDEMNRLYAARFPSPYPARTTVAVAALPKGARVELQAVAALR
jgi:2-iminobutanoate/2-iminopropanoate deaminase